MKGNKKRSQKQSRPSKQSVTVGKSMIARTEIASVEMKPKQIIVNGHSISMKEYFDQFRYIPQHRMLPS
jgi:hypothetical protein